MTSGPRTDLCNVDDGSTKGKFDQNTGDYTFQSIDELIYPLNYPPGDYIFKLIATSGSVSTSTTWTMTIKYPCPNVNFFLKTGKFVDQTYFLRDPEIVVPWTLQELAEIKTLGDCDAQTVTFLNYDVDHTPFDTALFSNTGSSFKINYN